MSNRLLAIADWCGMRDQTADESRTDRVDSWAPSLHVRRILTSNIVLGMALALLAWPYSTDSLHVVSGLGSSWETALAMAAHTGMQFGTRIVFTYGPLGFLVNQQLNYPWTEALSFLFYLALSTAVFGTLVWSLRRVVPLIVAVAVSYVVGFGPPRVLGTITEYGLALVLVVCVAVLNRADDDPAPGWLWMGLGGGLVVFSLVKVSLGVAIAAAVLATVACLPGGRWRALGALVIGAIPTFCVSWFGTGNGFGNMIAFVRSSAAIISGYAPAMSLEESSRSYAYPLAAIAVLIIGGFAVAHGRGLPRRSNIGIGLVTTVIVWTLLREGFVRHDEHDLIFFAAAPLVLVAFAPRRWPWALVPGVLVLTGIFFVAAGGLDPLVPRPYAAVRDFFDQAAVLASPGRTATVIEQSRQSLHATYALPDRMVATMRNRTVDVSPLEQTVAWAYPQIRFDPLPVIQDYSAYTPSLDRLDTTYLASSGAPRFILVQPGLSIDGRNPAFEPPATQLAIECRYHQVVGNTSWQLLERGPDRCGPLRYLGEVATGFRHWVSVPTAPAGDAIVARFQLSQGWLTSLEATVFKPPSVTIWYDSHQQKSEFRFVTGTASDAHVLSVASTQGYYKGFIPVSPSRLRFSIPGGQKTATGVKVSFYRVHVAPVAGGNGQVLPPLSTAMRTPASGTHVSGTAVLVAAATDYFRVTKVEFYLTGPSQHQVLIGTGGRTIYGWIAPWNTTKVANGIYTLQSVAYDTAGRSSRSDSITVTVKNEPA
jgi:hypothetical protein